MGAVHVRQGELPLADEARVPPRGRGGESQEGERAIGGARG